MWQRFTERARRAVFFAQEEAQRSGSGQVGPEHLLLGILREENTATQALAMLGADPDALRQEMLRRLGTIFFENSAEMTLTPMAKRTIDMAHDEARKLKHRHIGTEHLLLGILREGRNEGAKLLRENGVELDALRRAVAEGQAPNGGRRPVPHEIVANYFSAEVHVAVERAAQEAQADSDRIISSHHLLLGMLADRGGEVARILIESGVELDDLAARLRGLDN